MMQRSKKLLAFLVLLAVSAHLVSASTQTSAASDSVSAVAPMIFPGFRLVESPFKFPDMKQISINQKADKDVCLPTNDSLPIMREIARQRLRRDIYYMMMIENPRSVEYVASLLPELPTVSAPDVAFTEDVLFDMPEAVGDVPAPLELAEIKRIHWLHTFDGGIQFSQAYLSPNWYQGGSNNLSLLINFLWDVKLNEVYHPNLLFQNTVSYKLGLYSTPQDQYHKYSISEDIFQWNLKFGVKAWNKWFYSFTSQFKTQFINNYGENSQVRKASFLSPGELNVGLGMTYSLTNKKKNFKLNASIAPLSYNLKTCIDREVDPVQFNIPVGAKTRSQFGSSGELTIEWNLASNINYRSRLFLFSDYEYFLGDWENTVSFSINKFLSTQIYAHLRYDSSVEMSNGRWRNWMLKEILSFGFRYAFSTK